MRLGPCSRERVGRHDRTDHVVAALHDAARQMPQPRDAVEQRARAGTGRGRSSASPSARCRSRRRPPPSAPAATRPAAASSTTPRSCSRRARAACAPTGPGRPGARGTSGPRRGGAPPGRARAARASASGKTWRTPEMNQSISPGVPRKMPRSTKPRQRSGCASPYASASVEPHEPPKTSQRSMPSLLAQPLDVVDQQRRRVPARLAERRRSSGAALVEDDDAVVPRVEELPRTRARAAARTAVQEQHRHAGRRPAVLPVHRVQVVERQQARRARVDRRIELVAQLAEIAHDGG